MLAPELGGRYAAARVCYAFRWRGDWVASCARAQQPAMPVIGYLSGATSEMMRGSVTAFRHGLADQDLPKATTSPSNTDGQRNTTIGCLRWPQIWFAVT